MSKFVKSGDGYNNGEYIIHIHESNIIGRGAYGIVYECTKINMKETLCAKIIKCQGNNSDYLKRETDIINTLRQAYPNNPNFVKVYLCSYQNLENNEVLIVIMEKCASNLKDELAQKGKYTSEEVINILKQVLNGYKPLYEKAILHRDIKPENILISYDFQRKPIYKLADFGIGKVCKKNDFTMTKVGTPVYAAPELNTFVNDETLEQAFLQLKQIPNGKSQVDVYSIGIMLYQFLFGQPPFETKYPEQIRIFLSNIKTVPFKIQDKSITINSDLQEMIEKMIVYNPTKRIQFSEIYSNKLISIQTEQPSKFAQFRKTFIPESNTKFTPPSDAKFNQQNGQKSTAFPFTNPNSNVNLRATNPTPGVTSFQGSFPSNQDGAKPTGSTGSNGPAGPLRFTSLITDTSKQISFQQSTSNQQQAQFSSQIKSIQIDEIHDSQSYLKTQLSENSLLYSKYTENLLRQALESIQQFNQEKININSVRLMECFKYDEQGSYSLGFLKFYYCLIIRANKQMIKKQFNSEQELRQEITSILVAKSPQNM